MCCCPVQRQGSYEEEGRCVNTMKVLTLLLPTAHCTAMNTCCDSKTASALPALLTDGCCTTIQPRRLICLHCQAVLIHDSAMSSVSADVILELLPSVVHGCKAGCAEHGLMLEL